MKFMLFLEVSPPLVWKPKREVVGPLVRWQWLFFAAAIMRNHDFNDLMAAFAHIALKDPEGLLDAAQER